MDRRDAIALVAFLVITAAAAVIGSLSTVEASQQYGELQQPAWAPPSWLFGPVWTTLYIMIGVAGWFVWREEGLRSVGVGLWAGQMTMNALWSLIFFAWELRGLALGWIAGLDVVVAVLAWRMWSRDRRATWLLLPYLAWILFATALNGAVWWLNR